MLFATACLNINVGIFGVLFNLYLIAAGFNLVFIGSIAAITTVGQAVSSPLVGSIMMRLTSRRTMIAGAVMTAIAAALQAVVVNGAILVVFALLYGASFTIATVPAGPYMMEHGRNHERTHLFSAYFASATGGNMIGSLLSGIIPSLIALVFGHAKDAMMLADRAGLLLGAVVVGIGAFLFWSMPDNPTRESADRTISPLEHVQDEAQTRRDVVVMLAGLAIIALTMGTMPFFNVYFAQRLHASTGEIGAIFALSGVVCTIAAFLTPIVGRWGNLRGFNLARALTAPVFVVFWLHPGLSMAAAAFMARNSLGTISGALENTFGMEVIPARLRGIVASWRSFSFNAGMAAGSFAAGIVASHIGYDALFLGSAFLTLIGTIIYYGHFARHTIEQ